MQAMNNINSNLITNTGSTPLATLRFRSLDELRAAMAAAGAVVVERDSGRDLKRANFELLARNVVGSSTTSHTVIETLYVMRPFSFGPYGPSTVGTMVELQPVATITWSFQAGSAGEIPLDQMPGATAEYLRFNAPTAADAVPTDLLRNEVLADVRVTPLATGPVVHVPDSGATTGYVRHFRGMNGTLIEGVLPFSQLFDD